MDLAAWVTSWWTRGRVHRLLIGLGVLGFALRVACWWWSEGTNDIRSWHDFGQRIESEGLGQAYVFNSALNHPPLMGLAAALAAHLAESPLGFARLFKLPSLLAELGTGLLLVQSYRKRGMPTRGYAAFAAYGLSLSNTLISAYHGNTDALTSSWPLPPPTSWPTTLHCSPAWPWAPR